MKVRVTSVRINETGRILRPPFPVDITAFFDIDHDTGLIVHRTVEVEELYPLWSGLDLALADTALTPDGRVDAAVEFRIFQSPTMAFSNPGSNAFKEMAIALRNIDFGEAGLNLQRMLSKDHKIWSGPNTRPPVGPGKRKKGKRKKGKKK